MDSFNTVVFLKNDNLKIDKQATHTIENTHYTWSHSYSTSWNQWQTDFDLLGHPVLDVVYVYRCFVYFLIKILPYQF